MPTNRIANFKTRWFSGAWSIAVLCALSMSVSTAVQADPTLTVLHSFKGRLSDGEGPSGLVGDAAGNLYGTTSGGGASDDGTVFKLAPDGNGFGVLHSFAGGSNGAHPTAPLVADGAGTLYGTTLLGGRLDCGRGDGCGTLFRLAPDGTEFRVLHNFGGEGGGGIFPTARMVIDSAGNLFGTTADTVFKLAPDRTIRVLHRFCYDPDPPPCIDDGNGPNELLFDRSGNLYGATLSGGSFGNSGTVFTLPQDRTYSILHAFTGSRDGGSPQAGLIADDNGNLYGTTSGGGGPEGGGAGTVFKLAPDGTGFTVLHTFADRSDGDSPEARLLADSAGNLYGTTAFGGALGCNASAGCGTVFKVAPDGTGFIVLHSFVGGTNDGATPQSGLIADTEGSLYGTTRFGGGSGCGGRGCGTVFKLSGTGFVTATPFASFVAGLSIGRGAAPNTDSFRLSSSFMLGTKSDGIKPVVEPVILEVGGFKTMIPARSFKWQAPGFATFTGVIGGVSLSATIQRTGTVRYAFNATARGRV